MGMPCFGSFGAGRQASPGIEVRKTWRLFSNTISQNTLALEVPPIEAFKLMLWCIIAKAWMEAELLYAQDQVRKRSSNTDVEFHVLVSYQAPIEQKGRLNQPDRSRIQRSGSDLLKGKDFMTRIASWYAKTKKIRVVVNDA